MCKGNKHHGFNQGYTDSECAKEINTMVLIKDILYVQRLEWYKTPGAFKWEYTPCAKAQMK